MTASSPLLVCFATEDEARPFRVIARYLDEVEVLLTGIGPTNAGRAIERALSAKRYEAVINAGFAGGLDACLSHGALVSQSADEQLSQACLQAGFTHLCFTTHGRICTTPAEKKALRDSSGAGAVDMESAVIRAECDRQKVPFANVRVISDAADETLPLDFNLCLDAGMRLGIGKLLLQLAKSPGSVPRLMEFHDEVRRCSKTLATALTGMIASLRGNSARLS